MEELKLEDLFIMCKVPDEVPIKYLLKNPNYRMSSYHTKSDKTLIGEALKLMRERNDTSFQNRNNLYNFPVSDEQLMNKEYSEEIQRRLLSLLISNDSNLRILTRLGGFTTIIFPERFKDVKWIEPIQQKLIDRYKFRWSSETFTDIIVLRNAIADLDNNIYGANLLYLYDDVSKEYKIDVVGQFTKFYGLINILRNNELRELKLKRILKNVLC